MFSRRMFVVIETLQTRYAWRPRQLARNKTLRPRNFDNIAIMVAYGVAILAVYIIRLYVST